MRQVSLLRPPESRGFLFPVPSRTNPLAEPVLLGELGTHLRVAGSDHRVVERKPPLPAVVLGSKPEPTAQVAFQHLEFDAVLQTDDVLIGDGLPDGHGRLLPDLASRRMARVETRKRSAHGLDQARDLLLTDAVTPHVPGDDVSGALDKGLCGKALTRRTIAIHTQSP